LFLVSKLKQRLTTDGSILFKLTWREKVTPAGRLVYRLAASGRRTSDSDSGSWPTPNTPSGGPNVKSTPTHTGGMDLEGAVTLTSWPTPNTMEGGQTSRGGKRKGELLTGGLVGWPTASARDWKDTSGRATTGTNPDGSTRVRLDQLPRVAGLTAIGSPAATEKPGQLNPAHSRWLMGYPAEWDACAPTATPSSRKSRKPS